MLCGSGDGLCLYLPCLDERQLLRDLAGCLYQLTRWVKDVYIATAMFILPDLFGYFGSNVHFDIALSLP